MVMYDEVKFKLNAVRATANHFSTNMALFCVLLYFISSYMELVSSVSDFQCQHKTRLYQDYPSLYPTVSPTTTSPTAGDTSVYVQDYVCDHVYCYGTGDHNVNPHYNPWLTNNSAIYTYCCTTRDLLANTALSFRDTPSPTTAPSHPSASTSSTAPVELPPSTPSASSTTPQSITYSLERYVLPKKTCTTRVFSFHGIRRGDYPDSNGCKALGYDGKGILGLDEGSWLLSNIFTDINIHPFAPRKYEWIAFILKTAICIVLCVKISSYSSMLHTKWYFIWLIATAFTLSITNGIEWQHSYNQSAINNTWNECKSGYVVGGLRNIESILCVTPLYPTLISQTCYVMNISDAVTVECNEGYFVRGIYIHTDGNANCTFNCIEYLKCCTYDETQLTYSTAGNVHDCNSDTLCKVNDIEYITGFVRDINQLEKAVIGHLYLVLDQVKEFGFRTDYQSGPDTIILTLWFNFAIYECSLVPESAWSIYSCNSSTFAVIGSNCNHTEETKILLEYVGTVSDYMAGWGYVILLSNIYMETMNGILYGIDSICISDDTWTYGNDIRGAWDTNPICGTGYTHYDILCINSENSECWPPKQLFYFDTNRSNVDILNALWIDAVNVTIDIDTSTCESSNTSAITYSPSRGIHSFGVKTNYLPESGYTSASDTVTLTLWFNFTIFECILSVNYQHTIFSCDSSTFTIIDSANCTGETKMLIDNSQSDIYVGFSYIFIKTMDDITYGIDSVCIQDGWILSDSYYAGYSEDTNPICGSGYTHFSYVCIHNGDGFKGDGCGPGKQLVYFDTTRPNVYITNASWVYAPDMAVHITCDTPDIESFGVMTNSNRGSSSKGIILTLWYNLRIYQCVVIGAAKNTVYSCDSSTFTILDSAHCDNNYTTETKILIDNSRTTSSVGFERIFINTINNVSYGIKGVCIPDGSIQSGAFYDDQKTSNTYCAAGYSHYASVCIDNEDDDCAPGKQLISFDTTRPGIDIDNATWSNGDDFIVYPSLSCDATADTFCDSIDGGGWQLVRHSYNGWHPSTDNLNGTDIYGVYDGDPQSLSNWSIAFNHLTNPDGTAQFLFSNGNCSEWMIIENNEFTTSSAINPYYGHVILSHYSRDYHALWYFRNESIYESDPLLSFKDYTINNSETLLYSEGSSLNTNGLQRFEIPNADLSVNVWIRRPTNIVCDDMSVMGQCSEDIITCYSGTPCNVSCYSDAQKPCSTKTIQCPFDANCSIYCLGPGKYSCLQTTINCPSQQYDCAIYSNAAFAAEESVINGEGANVFVSVNAYSGFSYSTINAGRGNFMLKASSTLDELWGATINGLDCITEFMVDISEATWALGGDATIHCPSANVTCVLKSGTQGFESSVINGGGGDLVIYADDQGLYYADIYAGNGSLIVYGVGVQSVEEASVTCPGSGAFCNITCDGLLSCTGTQIIGNANIGTLLTVIVNEGGMQTLSWARIWCPTDSLYGNTHNCNIYIKGGTEILNDATFYVEESFTDLNLECWDQPCFEESSGFVLPKMYCKDDYSSSCDMRAVNQGYYNNEFECTNASSLCNSYRVPSFAPSQYPSLPPTTALPTSSPTKYKAFQSEIILYVAINGTDYGICGNISNACNTIQYAYDCLHGIDADYVNTTECEDRMDYDGYGTISIGEGIFAFPENITIKYSQIVIEGKEMNKTHLFGDLDIKCEWQCHLKMVNITYYGLNDHLNVDIVDGGHVVFDNVEFNYMDSAIFLVDAANIEWIDCIFTENDVFVNITSSAMVTFSSTSFINNLPIASTNVSNAAMINIESSTVSFDAMIFEANELFSSLINNVGNDEEITIESSIFRNNRNIDSVLLSLNCNGSTSILNSKFEDNDCTQSQSECIVVMNSNLLIDEYSLRPFEPTTAPTNNPTSSPTTSTDYYINLYPMHNRTFSGSIISTEEGPNVTFNIIIRSFDADCINPSIYSFVFRGGGFTGTSDRYLDLLDNNGSLIERCGMRARCYEDRVLCLTNKSFGMDRIEQGQVYTAHILRPYTDNSPWEGCESQATLDAVLTISCSSNPTTSPTISSNPTPSPTLHISSRILQFGHISPNPNNNDFNTLYLHDFTASNVKNKINLINFGAENGSITFEPCNRFTLFGDDRIFNNLSAAVSPTNLQDGQFGNYIVQCNNLEICSIECGTIFSCFASDIILNNSETQLIKCDLRSSCQQSRVELSSSTESSILCNEESSCSESVMEIDNIMHFVLECVNELSCNELTINITNTSNPQIICYGINSCKSITIYSDTDDIQIDLYAFNENVMIHVPSQFYLATDTNVDNHNVLNCNPNNGYLLLDSASFISLEESAKDEFGGNMPCQDVTFEFMEVSRPSCTIQYTFKTYLDTMMYFNDTDMFSCFHPDTPTFINDITNYTCFGTSDPTADPTTDPTTDPTIDPTSNPTSDPSTDPTNDPTSDPTNDPTADPTTDPTLDPTNDPTTDPTNDPTSDPTTDPTSDPTTDPTSDPTNDPTTDPTKDPTSDPTNDPTSDPTPSPSRNPTESGAYDSYFDITYSILHLEIEHIYTWVDSVVDITNDITKIIETGYVEATGLKYQFFWLTIDKIDNAKVKNVELERLLASRERISLQCTVQCGKAGCEILLDEDFSDSFKWTVEDELRNYFTDTEDTENTNAEDTQDTVLSNNTNNITFVIDTDLAEAMNNINELYPTVENPWLNPVLIASFSFNGIMFIISMMAFLHNKNKLFKIPGSNRMDDAVWLALTIYALQLFDFISDINLTIEMLSNDAFDSNILIRICGIASVIFIIVPYLSNLYFTTQIKRLIATNYIAKSYFENYSSLFVTLVCLSGSCHASLVVVSSAIFGLNILNSGLTKYDLRKLNKIKVLSTVFLENIPQLLIQAIYSFELGLISDNTYLAFIGSMISVINTLLSYCMEQSNSNLTVFKYYVETHKIKNDDYHQIDNDEEVEQDTLQNTTRLGLETVQSYENDSKNNNNNNNNNLDIISDEDRIKFLEHKGRSEHLAFILCEIFKIPRKNIEISKQSNITSSGVVIYVIHYVDNDNVDISYIKRLYEINLTKINHRFINHFDINQDFETQFRKNINDDNYNDDNSRDESNEIHETIKNWMNKRNLNDKEFINNYIYNSNNITKDGEIDYLEQILDDMDGKDVEMVQSKATNDTDAGIELVEAVKADKYDDGQNDSEKKSDSENP